MTETDHSKPSTFASRRADLEARRAAGEPERERRQLSIRATPEQSPNVVIRHVEA